MWKFRQIEIAPDGTLYALDAEGHIWYTNNNGADWYQIPTKHKEKPND